MLFDDDQLKKYINNAWEEYKGSFGVAGILSGVFLMLFAIWSLLWNIMIEQRGFKFEEPHW